VPTLARVRYPFVHLTWEPLSAAWAENRSGLGPSDLHFAGDADCHHAGGGLLWLHLQHQAANVPAHLDSRVGSPRTALPWSGGRTGRAFRVTGKRAESLAACALWRAVFPRRATLRPKTNVESSRCGRDGRACRVGCGECQRCDSGFRGAPCRFPLRWNGRGLLAGKQAPGDLGGPATGGILRLLGRAVGVTSFSESCAGTSRRGADRGGGCPVRIRGDADGDGAVRGGEEAHRAKYAGALESESGDFEFCRRGNSANALAGPGPRAGSGTASSRRAVPASR